jgi:hypothetical protein
MENDIDGGVELKQRVRGADKERPGKSPEQRRDIPTPDSGRCQLSPDLAAGHAE